jgi:hypothetical protein
MFAREGNSLLHARHAAPCFYRETREEEPDPSNAFLSRRVASKFLPFCVVTQATGL